MSKPVRRRGSQDGFTIIELMIAMAILGMGMVAAVSMHFGTARNNTNGNIITQANMLAKTQLETLKSQNVRTSGGRWSLPGPQQPRQCGRASTAGSIRSWTIENLGTDARRIAVTVEWGRFGSQRRVVISSNTKGNGV